MSASLVGSEMCIRDRQCQVRGVWCVAATLRGPRLGLIADHGCASLARSASWTSDPDFGSATERCRAAAVLEVCEVV
eukprot:4971609-Alexandrium_andersonii.AAC.1